MSDLIERAELIDKNMAQAKEIERLQARVEELEKDLDQARAGCYACEPVAIENKRLTAENAELKSYAEEEGERSEKQAKICIEVQARVESLEDAASYLSAEVKDAWGQGRISVDTFHAALAMDTAIAATEQVSVDETGSPTEFVDTGNQCSHEWGTRQGGFLVHCRKCGEVEPAVDEQCDEHFTVDGENCFKCGAKRSDDPDRKTKNER